MGLTYSSKESIKFIPPFFVFFDPFILHMYIISFTFILPHPIVEPHLSRIKVIDIPYHY